MQNTTKDINNFQLPYDNDNGADTDFKTCKLRAAGHGLITAVLTSQTVKSYLTYTNIGGIPVLTAASLLTVTTLVSAALTFDTVLQLIGRGDTQ